MVMDHCCHRQSADSPAFNSLCVSFTDSANVHMQPGTDGHINSSHTHCLIGFCYNRRKNENAYRLMHIRT